MRRQAKQRSALTRNSPLRSESGVSIAEVLIALVIFSTALLGVVGTAARVCGIMNSSHVRLRAGSIAQQQIEELLTQPYIEVKSGTATRRGVDLRWTVAETIWAKEVLLVYKYNVPGHLRADTLTFARIRRI